MEKNAFVYEWKNLTNNKSYIGYHKGRLDDGYISSSHNDSFWDDFNNKKMLWERVILFEGDKHECLKYEQDLLKNIDFSNGNYYNRARGANIIFTEDVIKKMSETHKNRWNKMDIEKKIEHSKRISNLKKGVPLSKETRKKISERLKGKTFIERYGNDKAKLIGDKISKSKTGQHYHSEEHKENLKIKMRGNDYGKNQSQETKEKKREMFLKNNPGKNPSEETKKRMSEVRKGIPAKNNKPIIIDNVEYRSLTDASDKLNIHKMTIKNRVLSKTEKFKNYKYK